MSLSNIRVRGFNGFAPLISSRNIEWLIDNPSFSVYRYDVQIGRISIENGVVTLEVFIEGEETFLNTLKTDVIQTIKENEPKVNDFIFDCYKSMGYTAGCKYLEPSITYGFEECKKILGIVPNSPQEYGFNEGWINAH